MNLWSFLNTYPGMYIVQSFFHSLVAALIVDGSLAAWDIRSPLLKQRFRLIVILFPIFSFPLYQLINPERGSIDFRLGALFDINRWLTLELPGGVPLGAFFFLILFATAVVFVLQELVPVLRHTVESRKSSVEGRPPEEGSPLSGILDEFGSDRPGLFILDDDDLVLFSSTGGDPAIFLSTGLLKGLDEEELRAAIAHEVAHIERSKRPLLVILYVLRVLMFFNPVVLVDFRRIVNDEEKICDDSAVSMTKNPAAMAGVIRKFRETEDVADQPAEEASGRFSDFRASLERYSHGLLMESRIARLEKEPQRLSGGGWLEFALTAGVVMGVNYFVV
jgi:hypothetical protein